MASEFSNIIHAASAFVSDFLRVAAYGFSARWPHCKVGGTPSARTADLDLIGQWMRIPRPMSGGVPAPDPLYREILKAPFSYHQAAGTEKGLLDAIRALGYYDVRYLSFQELRDPPLVQAVPGGPFVANQNAFGFMSSLFPVSWHAGLAMPSPGSDMDILLRTIRSYKRSSAVIWELNISETWVVSQEWWEGGQDPDNVEVIVSQEWWEGGQDPSMIEIVSA